MQRSIFHFGCNILFGLIALGGAISGCAPGLGDSLRVSEIAVDRDHLSGESPWQTVSLRVKPILDARNEEAIGVINGREVFPADNIGPYVSSSLEHELIARGAKVTQFKGPQISGEIKAWQVYINPGFPASSARANAEILLHILDDSGRVRYSGSYIGEASAQDPFMTEGKIESTLGKAMGFALKEALEDGAFAGTLASLQESAQ